MIAQLFLSALTVVANPPHAGANAEVLVGKVRVVGTAQLPEVRLRLHDDDPDSSKQDLKLTGDLVTEIARLQSALVEVTGKREDGRFVVQYYYILDVGGGVEPAVGTLVALGGGMLGLSDGAGEPIPLSIRPRGKARMEANVGAKVWVHGKELVSGQLKVLRYGVLRSARPASDAASTATAAEAAIDAQPSGTDTPTSDGGAEAGDLAAAGAEAEAERPKLDETPKQAQ